VRRLAALAPDGELSALECRALASHVSACPDCRSFAAEIEGLADALRDAPLEEPARRFVPGSLTRHRRRRFLRPVRTTLVAGTAAVFGIAVGVVAVGLDGSPPPAAGADTSNVIVVLESDGEANPRLAAERALAERRGPMPESPVAVRPGPRVL
jgi:anti-sigma factor RsiW